MYEEETMSIARKKLDERIQLRASHEEKQLLQLACELQGFRNLTAFIMNTMIYECKQVLKEHGGHNLSAKDSELVLEALTNPPKPNKELIALLKNKS